MQDELEQLLEAFLAAVHSAAEVANHLGAPSLRGAIGLQCRVLAVQVGLLVVAGDSGIADGQRTGDGVLVAKQVGSGVVPGASRVFRAGNNSPVASHCLNCAGVEPRILAASPIFTNRASDISPY